MKSIHLFFIITVLFISCKNDNTDKIRLVSKFTIEKTIDSEPVLFEKMPFCPNYITVIDSFIIVKNYKFCDNFFFHVYNKNSYKLMSSFGTEGKGPNEFLKPKPTGQIEFQNGTIGMWICDFHKFKYELINISQTIQENKTIIENEFHSPKATDVGLEVFMLDNGNLVGSSMSPEGRLFYFDAIKKTTRWVEYFPKVTHPPVKEKQMHNLYANTTKLSPDKKYVVSALRLFKRIDVFNDELEHLYSLVFKDSPKEPDFFVDKTNPISGKLVHYYTDLFLSKTHIYLLNSNITQEKLSKDVDTGYSEVQVFTYSGEPVGLYRLDHFIGSFAIDEENGFIIGVTMPKDDSSSPFIRYKLF